jgi:hypothetical protein
VSSDSPSTFPTSNEQVADAVVSRLYRRFKGWSQRGFGPEDVTWCEVKADVLALIREELKPHETSGDAAALRRYIVEQLGFLNDDDNCPAERFIRLAVAKLRAPETSAPPIAGLEDLLREVAAHGKRAHSIAAHNLLRKMGLLDAQKASAPTTCDTKCFGWPRCECGRRMP